MHSALPAFEETDLQGWMGHLRVLFPIRGLVHVGAGSGYSLSRYRDWSVPRALFVEAESGLFRKLSQIATGIEGWRACEALISDASGPQNFYVATNPNESGVLEPEGLTAIWRNLRTRERRQLEAIALDDAITRDASPNDYNWLIVDCLPALPVARGGPTFLAGCDVVVARTIVLAQGLVAEDAARQTLDEFLGACGFRALAAVPERQSAVATVIYVRDWRRADDMSAEQQDKLKLWQTRIEELTLALAAAKDDHKRQNVDGQRLLEDSDASRAELESMLARETETAVQLRADIAERDRRVDELSRALAAKTSEFDVERQRFEQQLRQFDDEALLHAMQIAEQKAALQQSVQTQAHAERLAQEREVQLENLTRAFGEQARQLEDAQRTIDQLNRSCGELVSQATARQVEVDSLVTQKKALLDDAMTHAGAIEELTALRGLSAQQSAQVDEAKRMQQVYAAEIATLRDQQDSLTRELAAREESVAGYRERIASLESMLAQQMTKIEVCNEDALLLRQARESAETKLRESEERLEAMRAELEARTGADEAHAAAFQKITRDHDEHARVSTERLAHIERLQADSISYLRQTQELESQLRELMQQASQLQEESAYSQQEKTRLETELAAFRLKADQSDSLLAREATEAGELRVALEKLKRDHDEHDRVSRERLAHIEKLTQEGIDREARILQLESERAEMDHRQRLLDDELVKAEAQIELIKDVVLREKAF
jgi:hypothetical protein